jgi:hypothetical protein
LTVTFESDILILTTEQGGLYMWRVYNEFGEVYTETYSRAEAERTADRVNGFFKYEDTAEYNPFYSDDWM